jgi:hypothetical protein
VRFSEIVEYDVGNLAIEFLGNKLCERSLSLLSEGPDH